MCTFRPFGATGAQKISEVSFVTFWHFGITATPAGIVTAGDAITGSIGIWRFAFVEVGTGQARVQVSDFKVHRSFA